MLNYEVINTIEGDRLEAIKLFADERVSGNIAGRQAMGLPVLHLKNGNSILIGDTFVSLLKETPKEAKEEGKEVTTRGNET